MTTAAVISARLMLDGSQYEQGLLVAKQKTQQFESTLRNIGGNMSNIGRQMSMAFTVPIAGGAVVAYNALNDLDTQMRNIQSISNQDDESLQALSQTFIEWSTNADITRDSASELAEGFYFIQSSGFAGAEGMEVLRVSTMAASAGLTETEVASHAILSVLNAYGMEAKDASYVSDVLFKTVDLGVLSFEDLASQLGDVVSTTSTLGVHIDEVGSAIALMTRKGISAPEAVTALNQLLLQFISPSEKMKEAAKELGIEWDKLNGILREEGLEATLDYMTEFGGDDAILSIFGDNVRALKGALALAKGGTGEFEQMNAEYQNISGRTEEAFKTQSQSTAAQMDNFKNNLSAMGMTLIAIVLPVLMQFLELLKPVIQWITEASPETQKWIVILLGLLAIAGPLLLFFGVLATGIASIVGLIGMITSPMLIVVAVIALIIGALVLLFMAWKNNWGGIQEKTAAFIAWIRPILTTLWDNLLAGIQAFIAWVKPIWENFWNGVISIFNFFKTQLTTIFMAFQAAFSGDWYRFGQLLRVAWDDAMAMIGAVLVNAGINIRNKFVEIVNNVINFFKNTNWAEVGMNIVRGIGNGIGSMTEWIVEQLLALGRNMMNAFNGFFGIHSPSTLMEERFSMIAAGANLGWRNNFNINPAEVSTQLNGSVSNSVATGQSSNTDIVSLLAQLLSKDNSINETTLSRSFRDAVLLIKE